MSNIDLKYLFIPGDGGIPPYLAGRKREQEYFQDCVEAMKNRKPVSQNLIVYGPRGNGKTALLRYLQKETLRVEKDQLDILWETPDEMGTLIELSARLTEDSPKLRDRFKSGGVSGGVGFAQANIEIDLSRPSATVRKILQERCQGKPFVLIIDEAHRLQPPIAGALLNASQTVRSEGNPFLLVLAGTPNLMAALGKTNASFWGRSKICPLGRLSPDEAGQAVTIPLEQAGISFAPGVVEEIVEHTHSYPFFLQIWGDCLARKLAQTGQTGVTLEMLREIESEAHRDRDTMYQTRFDEIRRMRLLPVAESVADVFIQSGQPTLHERTLEEAVAKGMAGDDDAVTDGRILEKLDQLYQLGYVWRIEGADYEPGIPSLISYVHRNSLTQQPKEESCSRIA